MIRNRLALTFVFLVCVIVGKMAQADSSWQFTDLEGTVQKPFDDQATKAMVLVFVSTDCPIANSYQPLLHRMSEQHRENGIRFFMIHPDPKTSPAAARKHAHEFGIQVPVVIDLDQSISLRAGATVTPEAFVFVRDQAAPVYQGRIDDLHADYGKKRTAATTHELADALDSVVAGKPVGQARTEAIGCFIAFQEKQPATPTKEPVDYDPLKVADEKIETLELTIKDSDRSREIPVLVYLPKSTEPAAVIIHSHGLGGTKKTSTFLGKHWAGRGYVAVFVQHPGSDDSVWKDTPASQRMDELRKAASGQNLKLRTGDVHAVIDQLEQWNAEESHPLHARMDLKHVGMSGHSFGAVTTQHVSGQKTLGSTRSRDERIRAAIPMSPSSPALGDPKRAFGEIAVPWLCLTGTRDTSPIGNTDAESRLAVFEALPPGDKYELVLHNAEHSVFTERALPGESLERNPNHHRAIMAITTAFWDRYLREDPAAKSWLEGDSVQAVLEPEDRWQKK